MTAGHAIIASTSATVSMEMPLPRHETHGEQRRTAITMAGPATPDFRASSIRVSGKQAFPADIACMSRRWFRLKQNFHGHIARPKVRAQAHNRS